MLRRRHLIAAATCAALPALAGEPFRGQRGDWSIILPPQWYGETSDSAERHKRAALAGGAEPLLRVMTAIAALAQSADAVLFSFGGPGTVQLPVITVNSSAPGTSARIPRPGDDEMWAEIARTMAASGAKLRKPWYGTRKRGEPMTAAVWETDLAGKPALEEMIIIQRPRRVTSLQLVPSSPEAHGRSRPDLWTIAETFRFDEAP